MVTQITATLPTLNFPREVDYPTQEDWAAFSAAAELNFGILGGSWSTQMQLWKNQANAMSIESNNNADIAQAVANYQGDWVSQGYTLGQTVSVSGIYYICKLTHATGQNPTTGGSIYWNLAIGNWNLKVNNYGNETIAGVKTFSSNIVGNITGNAGTATKLNTARTINGVAFDGSTNITVDDSTAVKLTGNETIAGVKTFSSNIVGNITGNAQTATSLLGDETNWASYRSRSVANMLGWEQYGNGHVIFDASSGTTPGGTSIDTNNPQVSWSSTFPTLMGWNGASTHGVRVDSARVADSTTYATAFTTAVGSAPSYACRAWVNFNGTGTVAIRASGNVSSITDNGAGDYTVNFTTAMPDDGYSTTGNVASTFYNPTLGEGIHSITQLSVNTGISNVSYNGDVNIIEVQVFR